MSLPAEDHPLLGPTETRDSLSDLPVPSYNGRGSVLTNGLPRSRRTSHRYSIRHSRRSTLSALSELKPPKPAWRRKWDEFAQVYLQPSSLAALSLIGVVLGATGEQVTRKVVATSMYNYRWAIVQIFVFGSFLVSAGGLAVKWSETKRLWTEGNIPVKSFAWMAVLDSLYGVFLMVAIGIVPGPVSVLVPQGIVPLSVIMTFLTQTDERCQSCYFIGVPLTLLGLFFGFLPDLFMFQPCDAGGRGKHALVANVGILFASIVPGAMSNVYKRSFLRHNEGHQALMNFSTALLQLVVGVLLAPAALELQFLDSNSIPGTGTDTVSRNIFTNLGHAFVCMTGSNRGESGDDCGLAGGAVCIYLTCVVLTQVSFSGLLQHADEVTVYYAQAAAVALAYLSFYIPGFVEYAVPPDAGCLNLTVWAGTGLVLTLAGLVSIQMQKVDVSDEIDIWGHLEAMDRQEEEDHRHMHNM